MTENNEEVPLSIESSSQKSGADTVHLTGMMKQLLENHQKLMERLQSIEDNQNGRKRKREESDSENPAKKADLDTSAVDQSGQGELEAKTSGATSSTGILNQKSGKCFTLKHTFKNVSELENGMRVWSEPQEHFGIIWKMYICHDNGHLEVYTRCQNETAKGTWSIKTNWEVKLMSKNGKPDIRKCCDTYEPDGIKTIQNSYDVGWDEYLKWDELEPNFLIDDSLTFEVSFEIKNTTGIFKSNLRCFNDPECSDVVLIVQNTKFHVLKLYLATHSSYFKAMFLGMFEDAKKSEIKLDGIDVDDFQRYLEVLYGENAVDEYTVEGILMIADMYDTPLAVRKCEEFLLEISKTTLKKKLELSVKYRLEILKEDCLSKINTSNDIRAVLPANIRDLDHSLLADLLEKSLTSN